MDDSFDKSGVKAPEDLDRRLRDLKLAGSLSSKMPVTTTQLEELLLPFEGGGKKEADKNSSPGEAIAHTTCTGIRIII